MSDAVVHDPPVRARDAPLLDHQHERTHEGGGAGEHERGVDDASDDLDDRLHDVPPLLVLHYSPCKTCEKDKR